jgi:hypothetical protein
VHDDRPIVFHTRWAMSYLRGPLTRQQVGQLMEGHKGDATGGAGSRPAPDVTPGARTAETTREKERVSTEKLSEGLSAQPPALPPSLQQTFIPGRISAEEAVRRLEKREERGLDATGTRLVYQPMVLGMARVSFVSRKLDVDEERHVALVIDPPDTAGRADWEEAEETGLAYRDLADEPAPNALFDEVPSEVSTAVKLDSLKKGFSDHLYREQAFILSSNKSLGLHSRSDESAKDFAARCRDAAREARDTEVDKLSDKYEKKLDVVQDRLARKERSLVEDEADYQSRKREEVLSAGESVLGVFLGRRSSRAVSTAARKRSMTAKAKADISDTQAELAKLREDVADLQAEMRDEAEEIARKWEEALDDIEEVRVTPRRTDIDVELLALAWTPYWEVTFDERGRERTAAVPAYRP